MPRTEVNEPRSEPARRPERTHGYLSYLAIGLFAVLGLTLVWTRMLRIEESFWHAEAFTVLNYSGVGPRATLFAGDAFDVNNHVAYNLLSWATTRLVGTSEAMYRIWSVIPAIAAIGLAAWWAWRRIGPVTAIAFAALAVAAPLHLALAPQARGYGLALLAATLMLIAADRLTRVYSRAMLLGFLGAGLLGIWTLPMFAIAFAGQALSLLRWRQLRRPVLAAVGAAGVLSLLLYAPVLGTVLGGPEGEGETISLGAALTLVRSLEWLAVPVRPGELAGWMGPAAIVAALALVVVAIVGLWRRREIGLALLLVVPPLLFNLVFAIGGFETAERHQFLLLTHVLVLVAAGIGELGGIVARYRPLRPVAIGAGALAVLAFSIAAVERQQRLSDPLENFKQAANIVHGSGIDPVVTDSIRPEGLRYYVGNLVELAPSEVEALLCDRRQPVVYIRHLSRPPEDWGSWSPASLDCVARRPSVRVAVPQRRAHSELDVWIVGPRATRETIEG